MHMSTDDLGNTTCQEVPYHNAAIVAANGKQCAMPIECTGQGHADTVQCAIGVLQANSIYQDSRIYRLA